MSSVSASPGNRQAAPSAPRAAKRDAALQRRRPQGARRCYECGQSAENGDVDLSVMRWFCAGCWETFEAERGAWTPNGKARDEGRGERRARQGEAAPPRPPRSPPPGERHGPPRSPTPRRGRPPSEDGEYPRRRGEDPETGYRGGHRALENGSPGGDRRRHHKRDPEDDGPMGARRGRKSPIRSRSPNRFFTGSLKMVSVDKAFGFVVRDDNGKDIYFSLSSISEIHGHPFEWNNEKESSRIEQVRPGDPVKFREAPSKKNPGESQAVKVVIDVGSGRGRSR